MLAIKENKTGLFFFLIAVIFAFIAAVIAVSAVNSFNKQTTAYVVTEDIPAFTKITEEMIEEVTIPEASIIGTKVERKEEFIGKYTNTALLSQVPILRENLANSPGGEITAELNSKNNLDIRALPIPVTAITGFGGKLNVGDRLDFIATLDTVTNQGNQMVTRMIAQNIPVSGQVEDGGKLVGIVIEASAKEVQEISHYMETGRLKLSVHPQPSNGVVELNPTVTSGFNPVPNEQNGGGQ